MPKKVKNKNKRNNNSYYNPNYSAGYNVLNNLELFKRVGTAMLSHDQTVASLIDSAMRSLLNAEEIEWNRKKERDRKEAEDIKSTLKENNSSILGQLAAGSRGSDPVSGFYQNVAPNAAQAAYEIGSAYGHIKNKDLPNMPKDYGMSDFLKDQWNSFFGEMNHLQAEDARGYQTRMTNDKSLIQDYMDSLDMLDEIEEIDFRINQLRSLGIDGFTEGLMDNINKQLSQLIQRKQNLLKSYNSLSNNRKLLEDMVTQSSAGAAFDDLVKGNQYYGKGGLTGIFGKTTALHDEINDARRFLWDLNNPKLSTNDKRRRLTRALKEYDTLNKGWEAIAEENEKDAKKHKDKVTPWFKGREAKAGTDFFDPDTYLFKMPGIIGGSSSSYMKQIPAMIAGIAGGLAANTATGGLATGVALATGGGTAFAFNRGAGVSENNAEVALAAKERVKQRTGLSEEDFNKLVSGKLTDPAKLRKVTENIKSVENLFNEDMAATTWDAAVDAALGVVPVGMMSRLGTYIKGTKAFEKAMENPVTKRILNGKLGLDLSAGYGVFGTTGAIGGVVGAVGNATIGRGAREAARRVGNFVVRKTDNTLIGAMAHDLWKHTDMLGKAALNINPVEKRFAQSLINGTKAKYAKGIGGRLIRSAISEGVEEGKQHVNAEAFKNGQMDQKYMDTFDVGLTDFINGMKMGAYVLGIPLDGLGLIDIKDEQLLQEIKGGMLGGWGHTATVTVAQSTIPYLREQSANELILQQFYADKLASQADFKQYTNWVKKGLFKPGYNDVLAAFDRLRQINNNYKDINGIDGISPSLIDRAEEKYKNVISIAQDPITRIEAENAGIIKRSKNPLDSSFWKSNKEYHEFVAAKAIALDKIDEISQHRNEANVNVAQAQADTERHFTVNSSEEQLLEVLDFLQSQPELDSERVSPTIEEDKNGRVIGKSNPTTTQTIAEDLIREKLNSAAITKNVAYLAALLKYRETIETAIEAQKNNPHARVRRGLKDLLSRLNHLIDISKKEVQNYVLGDEEIRTLKDLEDHMVFEQEYHERLRDAYENQIKWSFEYDSALLSYYNLVGERQRIGKDGKARNLTAEDFDWNPRYNILEFTTTKGNAKKILEDIHKMEKDDDDFEAAIEQVFQSDLKAEHLNEENGWENPQVAPNKYRPVNDTNGDQIIVQIDENGRMNRDLADNEFISDDGRLWEDIDYGRKDILKEALKPRDTHAQVDQAIRDSFAETWRRTTGTVLPLTPEGFIEQRKRALIEKASLSSSNPPTPSSDEGRGNKPPVTPPNPQSPPTPPTPPSNPQPPVEPEKSPQLETIDWLEQKYEDDKKVVHRGKNGDKYNTTSLDYFVDVDNKVVRMSRVHNVKPESYIHQDEIQKVELIYQELLAANTLKEIVQVYTKHINADKLSKLDPYYLYLEDNQGLFFNNPTQDTVKEYKETLLHIAQSIVNENKGKSSSIRMGNIADELFRNFFGTPDLYSLTANDSGIVTLFHSINESEKKSYQELFNNNFEQFKSLTLQLRQIYKYLTKDLKWELRALPFTWRGEFKNIGWVAGETDLIGVDQQGNIHIIDFKTSKYTFLDLYIPNTKLTLDYVKDLKLLNETDFLDGIPNQKARNILRTIQEDSNIENIAILWNSTLNTAVIVNKDRPFTRTPNAQYGQIISAYEDYSNQQTAYARMIQLENQNVASIQLMAFVCSYDYEMRLIDSVRSEGLIALPMSKTMLDILDNVTDSSSETINAIREQINDVYDQLSEKIEYINDKISDDIFNTLSEEGKIFLGDFVNAFNNIVIPEEDDINLLNSVLGEITDLLNSWQLTIDKLREDWRNEKARLAAAAEHIQKAEQKESKVLETPPGDAVDTVRARNKNESRGNTSYTNLNYLQVEADRDLELATSAPDFITSADFSLYVDGDEVYVDISYNGKTWKRIKIDTKYNGKRFTKGEKLINSIIELQKQKTATLRIVPVRATMNRTNGAINKYKGKKYVRVNTTDLFANQDIYDIEFSPKNGIGIIDNSGQAVSFNGSATNRSPIYSWRNPNHVPKKGTMIYLKHVRKDELNRDSIIPVAIDRVKLLDTDINFILNILDNSDLLDKEYYAEINGQVYNTYATGRQFINLLIPVIDDVRQLGNITSILRDPNNPNIIRLLNRNDVLSNLEGRGRFDLSVPESRNRFIAELKTMSIAELHGVLTTRLATDNNRDFPFAGIRRLFILQNSGSNKMLSIKLSDNISFDLDDFKIVTSRSGVKREGLNGFAYYLKHNILITQYAGMGSCNVEIQDVILEDQSMPEVLPNGTLQIPKAPTNIDYNIDSSAIDAFLLKLSKGKVKKRKLLTEKEARDHIRKLLGDSFDVRYEDGFLKLASGAANVIGCCKADAIVISNLAYRGVEYHEAFHRIFETLIDPKRRDAIYQKIAKRLGVQLYNADGSENKSAFRECAEYAADHYMDYMNWRINDIKIPFLTKAWNIIHDFVSGLIHIKDKDLYKIFVEVNNGTYKNIMPSKKEADRFNRLYKELHVLIHGVEFENIMNSPMYDTLKETVLFCILRGQNVDTSGRNIQQLGKHIDKETFKKGIDKLLAQGYDIIGQKEGVIPTVGQLAMKELYDKFDTEELRDDIANALSFISTDYMKIYEEESIEDAQGDEQSVVGSSIGEHTRASYEFSRFSKTSSRVRFFFATIPNFIYGEPTERTDENGNKIFVKQTRLALNEFGLPTFVPVNVVFNEFLNYFHDVDTVDELISRLQYFSKEDPMFEVLYKAIEKLHKSIYKVEDGNIVRNSDLEALFSQLMNVIRSNRHKFDIARSHIIANGQFGMYTIDIQPSDTDYNAKFYPTQWNQMLVNGGTPFIKVSKTGALQFNPSIKNSDQTFVRIQEMFSHSSRPEKAENGASYNDVGIKQWLDNAMLEQPQPVYLRLYVNGSYGYYNNPNDASQLEVVKDKIVEALNFLGINFSIEELNYMLRHKYGSTDAQALAMMFDSVNIKDSMSSFISFLGNVSSKGVINKEVRINGRKVKIENAYSLMAFIKELANWKYQYRHSRDLLTVLATGNNKFYEISDNNYISDVIRFINKRSDEFEEIKSDIYNYFRDTDNVNAIGLTPVYGSILLKEITGDPNLSVTFLDYIGFKTDKRNDLGSDYFEITRREDYVSKASILQHGGILLPTLSDKKSYGYITMVDAMGKIKSLPGLDYNNITDNNGNVVALSNLGQLFVIPKDPRSQLYDMLSQNRDVIDAFISYAITEYKSVLKADADLDEMERNGTKSIEVDNYYKKEQGARFSSLIGVWEYDYKKGDDGNMYVTGETFHSFNNKNKSRKDNIKEAEKYFFNRSREEQEMLIQRLLHKRFLKEVDTCVELGLIEKIKNSDNIFENYKNVGLDAVAIEAIYKALVALNGEPADVITADRYKSLAVMIYIQDISNKAIMSGQEVERVFSGNPSFYKWKFDDEGNLIDRTVDELKRLGGLVSTGNNNFLELKDIPSKYIGEDGKFTGNYVCAQVGNELILSPQSAIIKELMYYGEISTAAYLKKESVEIKNLHERFNRIERLVNQKRSYELSSEDLLFYNETNGRLDEVEQEIRLRISELIDSLSMDELEQQLDDTTRNIALRKAEEAYQSYVLHYDKNGKVEDGIDVADGAAYISDTMAEMLLRMNGNYSTAIEKAFKILRGETRSTILERQLAYQAVVTEVIGSQKYTAFGRRTHTITGVQIAYYNKMALFPLFQCMSTGRMQNIFNKMKLQGIDMLMVDSAVKVGGQYSKNINWDDYMLSEDESDPNNHVGGDIKNPLKPSFDESFQFGTYEQKFIYLRKQLNTDPKDDYSMSMGTQMTKIVLTNLFDGRLYYFQDGSVMNGMELKNDMMNIINILSDKGLVSITKRFFKTDKDGNVITDGNGNKILDEVKFSKEIRKLLITKDPDKNILNAIELVEQKDDDGVTRKHMRLPLNAISNSNWLESVLISSINKKVIDIETPGAAFIQRSVWAMEGSALYERSKGNIISDENLSPKINNGERLEMINEEGSMDCVVSIDFIKKMFKGEFPKVPVKDKNRNVVWDLVPERDLNGEIKRDKDGKIIYAQRKDKSGKLMVDEKGNPVYKRTIRMREMTFDELRKWLINRGIIGKGAKANIIGYRIPTQAQSSIHCLRIVDVLPVVNDTIILPAEFTKITGSDFDIDKLFLSSIQYKVDRIKEDDDKYHQTVTDQFEEGSDEYYRNKLLRDYITLLLDWKSPTDHNSRTANFLHRSIDNDTELLKAIIRDLEAHIAASKEEPYGFYSLSTQTAAKNDYITGKIGIGPFALNNNNHILTMMYHVRFKHIESSIMSTLELESLDNRVDKNGESIMSWISALINAHVDIAKDPYISRLNVNPFTYNIVNLLIRTGLGDKTFYFTTQPIMKELATAYINAGAMYMADPYLSKYKLQQDAVDTVAENWFKDSGITFEGYSAMELIKAIKTGGAENKTIRQKVNNEIKKLFDNSIKSDAKSAPNLQNQLFYYLAYLQFDKYAVALSNLVMYSKIDTKKHGKSVTEQLVYEKGFNRTYDITRESNLFEPVGLRHMMKDSYIAKKTQNAIGSIRDILKGQFIQSTPAFLGSLDRILNSIGRTESLSPTLVKKVADALSAAIKSKFFTDEYVPSITDNPHFIHDLISESLEELEFTIKTNGNVIELSGDKHHDLRSYVGGTALFMYKGQDGNYYPLLSKNNTIFNGKILQADDATNSILLDTTLPPMYGKIVLKGGKNTIYDRFMRLQVAINSNPVFSNLKSPSGEIGNRLLQMLVDGKTVEYTANNTQGERPDTYETMKFVKFFNFVEDSGNTANYIIDAWDELLHYTNDNKDAEKIIRDFARDLIVYGFITSGDKGGFTKIFKYVPTSWREESGYGNYIQSKLIDYSIGLETDIDTDDVILNNWFDNDFVRTYKLIDKDKKQQFITYTTKIQGKPLGFPTILVALKKDDNGKYVPSIDPENAPMFIKIARKTSRQNPDSQRRMNVYKFHKMALSNTGVEYPIYIKVNPKGNLTTGNFLITEYGRDDSINQQEYEINEKILEQTYKASNVSLYIASISKSEPEFASIISGLNRAYNREQEKAVSNYTNEEQQSGETAANIGTDYNGSIPGILALATFGRMHEVDKNILLKIKEIDKQRDDYDRITRMSPVYMKLQAMLRNLLGVADTELPENASEELQKLLQELKDLQNSANRSNILISRPDDNDSLLKNAKIYHDYHEKATKYIATYIKEFYNIDAPVIESEWFSGERRLFANLTLQQNTFDDSGFTDEAMKHCTNP